MPAAPMLGKKARGKQKAIEAAVGKFATPSPPKLVLLKDHRLDED